MRDSPPRRNLNPSQTTFQVTERDAKGPPGRDGPDPATGPETGHLGDASQTKGLLSKSVCPGSVIRDDAGHAGRLGKPDDRRGGS